MNLPPMTDVNSRNLKSIGHDGRALFVAFRSGVVYSYDGVPPDVYGEGVVAPSPNLWFKENVKGKFPYQKVQQDA
jgi:hypothetical protein